MMRYIRNLLKRLFRLGGWDEAIESQEHQQKIIRKMYAKHGFEIVLTCPAFPEQYEVTKDGAPAGYLRLRHGEFRVDYPECLDRTIFKGEPKGDGIFNDDERLTYMKMALNAILEFSPITQP